ncbi:hypothetical protein [Thiobacillus sedimenti]|uniref:SPOR domain-containing protein n=1 Tax=Thiobacillus sedimenti TaxID=3110231 RepID=A0ABZ1CKJ2_9PROT|nr:hypothetical protein [Thiobacillus sp. SCUT-2]WRS39787.1 hypothetical protein VA613_02670 [Thiobacillus sp. SCUT-2]
MKWIAWALLAANVMVAALFVGRSHWSAASSGAMPPLNVDRVGLRSQSAAAAKDTPAAPEPRPASTLCVEWRGLNGAEFAQVRDQLKALAGERVMSFSEVPVSTRYWVIFPPLPSAQAAAAKLDELVAAGLSDAFVVKDDAWRNAISLGLYGDADAAQRRVLEAESKGVLGTRIEIVPRQGTEFYFVIRSEDPDTLKSLGDIRQAYPNSRQSRVACPAS